MSSKLEIRKLIEAILFVAGRPVPIEELKKSTSINEDAEIKKIIKDINEALEKRKSFIEILAMDKDFWMRVKPDKKEELPRMEKGKSLSSDLMQIVSYIAIKQPIRSTEVKKVIKTKKFNEKLAQLEKSGFIRTQPYKRALICTTTLHFASVFNLDPEHLKESMMTMLKYKMAERIKKGPEEEEEKEEKEGKKKRYTKKEKEKIDAKYEKLIERKEKEREAERKRKEEEERLRLEEEQRMAEIQADLDSDPMAQMIHQQFLNKQLEEKLKGISIPSKDSDEEDEILSIDNVNDDIKESNSENKESVDEKNVEEEKIDEENE